MSRTQIRELVEALLKEHRITSVPVNIEELARVTGTRVVKDDLNEAMLSGFAVHKDGSKVIGVNASESPVRQRFTIAHELGHLFLHKNNTVNYDQGGMMLFRNGHSSDGTDIKEIEANRFAAELLMPEAMIKDDLAKEGQLDLVDDSENAAALIEKLAEKYEVSRQAMSIRLATLYFG